MTELRQFPRINLEIPAELTTTEGGLGRGVLSNLSPGGVMIRGNLAFKEVICPAASRDAIQHQITAKLRSQLPNEVIPLEAECRLVYVRRLAQDSFELGLRFVGLTQIAASMLHRLIFNEDPPSLATEPHKATN